MKKLYAAIFLIFSFYFCHAQYVIIPDANFANWLNTNTVLTGCVMNGNQLDTTCPAVLSKRTIDFGNSAYQPGGIADLTGIQYFKNLDTLNCSYNLIQSLSKLPSTLEFLDCSNNVNIDSIPSYLPSGLLYLNCSYVAACSAQCTTIPPKALPPGLQYLNCFGTFSDSLPTLPQTLTYLNCASNNLTSLPILPNSLIELNCDSNLLVGIPALPSSLDELYCSYNQLTSLPVLPSSLINLDCSYNILSVLPTLPSSLNELACSNNQLTGMPVLPSSLGILNCSNNQLTSLPSLPSEMYNLDCSYNKLTGLPPLTSPLGGLTCSNNQLTSLPSFPPTLQTLDCSSNQLTSLPTFPLTLQFFYCSHNLLTSIPSFPLVLQTLDCSSNQLTSLPSVPLYLYYLYVDSNKFLTCLPPVLEIAYDFNISGTGITCLPDQIAHPYAPSVPAIDTMPLCNIFNNPYGCIQAWNITGNSFFDTANNCDTAITEPGLGKIKLMLYDSTGINLLQQVITNGDGSYSFNSGLGKYIVRADTTGTPFYVLCPDTNALHCSITASDSLDYGVNLRLACKNGYDVGVNSIYYYGLPFFPGRSVPVNIQAGDMATYYGVNCNTGGLAGTVVAVITGPVAVSSASGNGIISGNMVTWNIADFSQTNFATAFNVVLNTNKTANAGDQVCIDVSVAGNSGTDNNPSNNNLTQCFAVTASHDPNFKEVYPSSTTNPGEWLTYTIHFQNTGTAAAENIYVLDTIDNNLDISTIQVVAESNNALIQVLPGRIVRFSFPNIFLPDSLTNVDSSIGYVQYKIKTISTIAPGTTINNTASVYFDYNQPVQTNTAVSVYDISTSNKELTIENGELRIYPNPTGGIVNIILPQSSGSSVIEVTDVLGRTLLQEVVPLSNGQGLGVRFTGRAGTTIDLSSLAAGIYYIRVRAANETATAKVIKQ